MLHGHGDDAYLYPGRIRANFSSNVPPDALPPGLLAHLRRKLGGIVHYPEAAAETFTAQFARVHGVGSANVLVTSGGTAAIQLLAQAWRARRACVITPTFSEYEDASRAQGTEVRFVSWEDFAAGALPASGVVWLCNPNNPTGAVLDRGWLLARILSRPHLRFVVDQAYAPLCAAPALTAIDAVATPNLLLLHSLTKQFAIPGLRLGAIVGPARALAPLRRLIGPWSVNSLALAAGEFLLGRKQSESWSLPRYLARSRELQSSLAEIRGVTVRPSETGYFLFRCECRTGAEVKNYLRKKHGWLVRDAGNFRGLGRAWVRVAVQRPRENQRLVAALKAWMRPR